MKSVRSAGRGTEDPSSAFEIARAACASSSEFARSRSTSSVNVAEDVAAQNGRADSRLVSRLAAASSIGNGFPFYEVHRTWIDALAGLWWLLRVGSISEPVLRWLAAKLPVVVVGRSPCNRGRFD